MELNRNEIHLLLRAVDHKIYDLHTRSPANSMDSIETVRSYMTLEKRLKDIFRMMQDRA